MAQRIVIPKGTVNPGETSVIEIPHHFQASSVVIASPKAMNRSVRSMTSAGSPIAGPSHRYVSPPRKLNFSGSECVCPDDSNTRTPTRRRHRSEPTSPNDSFRTAANVSPGSLSLASGASVYGTPTMVRRRPLLPEPRSPSFEFDDEDSVYDDTFILERRKAKEVNPPQDYDQFKQEMESAQHKFSPEGAKAGTSRWPTMRKGTAYSDMDPNDRYELKCMMQNVQFARDLRSYQKARRNLVRQAAKITHQAFRNIATCTSKAQRRKLRAESP